MLSLQRIQEQAEASFQRSVDGVDLIVGARSGDVQLMLSTVFRVGNHPDTLSWGSFESIRERPEVDWAIPMITGDGHRGYPLVGVGDGFYQNIRFGSEKSLDFTQGRAPYDLFDVVLGAEVAVQLGYSLGDEIVISHGGGEIEHHHGHHDDNHAHEEHDDHADEEYNGHAGSQEGAYSHADRPFRVAGILTRTGSPVDRQLLVSVEGYAALHIDWVDGMQQAYRSISKDRLRQLMIPPERLNAVYVGTKHPSQALDLQYWLQTSANEPLSAVLPGVALQNLWGVVGGIEQVALTMAWGTLFVALAGFLSTLLASQPERFLELAVYRALGIGPGAIAIMLLVETIFLTSLALLVSWLLVAIVAAFVGDYLQAGFGVSLGSAWPSNRQLAITVIILGVSLAAAILPAVQVY